MPSTSWAAILFLAALAMNAVLAAGRSALVNSRQAALRSLEEKGFRGAQRALAISEDATQLIISMRTAQDLLRLAGLSCAVVGLPGNLLLGGSQWWLVVVLLAAGLLTGAAELAAESLVLRSPERWGIRLAGVVSLVSRLTLPIGSLVQRLAGALAGTPAAGRQPVVTEEEIKTLVDAGEEGGAIEQEEKAMIFSIFQLSDTLAREIMVPRIDMQAFESGLTLVEATEQLRQTGHSRAPVYAGAIDQVVGVLYAKDVLAAWEAGEQDQTVGQRMRQAYFVPEAMKADDLLTEMQKRQVHVAIVVDEYGGTAGMVTIEDIVEEIVGEIRDEYDKGEESAVQRMGDGEFLFTGGIDLDDVNEIAEATLPKLSGETLAGFLYGQLGRVPVQGERVEAGGLQLTVEQVVGRRIRKVRATRLPSSPGEAVTHAEG
jgi:putative hemolysin